MNRNIAAIIAGGVLLGVAAGMFVPATVAVIIAALATLTFFALVKS